MNETANRKRIVEFEYDIGDRVRITLQALPRPAKVIGLALLREGIMYNVQWFGATDVQRVWLAADDIEPWTEPERTAVDDMTLEERKAIAERQRTDGEAATRSGRRSSAARGAADG